MIDLFYNLSSWLNSNMLEIDFYKIFERCSQNDLIKCQDFVEVLITAGYDYCED